MPEDVRRPSAEDDFAPQSEMIRIQGDPYEAQRHSEEARHRREFIDLTFQRAELERRKDHINPRAYAAQAAGLEYDLAQFEAGTAEAFADRRNLRRSAKDIQALETMFANGEIDEQQLSQGLESAERTYGPNVLVHNPGWRRLRGADQEFQQAKQGVLAARAEQLKVEPEALRWDDRIGKPVLDEDYFAAQQFNTAVEKERQKPVTELRQVEYDIAEKRYRHNLDVADKQYAAMLKHGEARGDANMPEQALHAYNQLRATARADYDSEVLRISQGARELVQQPAAPQAPAAPQIPAQFQAKVPRGTRFAGEFSTPAEAGANVPNDSYAVISGMLFRRNITGKWEAIN